MKNIYVTGMMGSGKSVTAACLAKYYGTKTVDTDELIVGKAGMSINQIFKDKGEKHFRDLETEILRSVVSNHDQVVSTGGGIVLRKENVSMMKSTGTIVYLKGAVDTLWERLKDKNDRPLLKVEDPKGKLQEILKERKSFYEGSADIIIDTDGKTPEEVAKEIESKIKDKPRK